MHFSEDFQLEMLRGSMSYRDLSRPAMVGDGISVLSPEEFSMAVSFFDQNAEKLRMVRFVPSSGAASRMFADLQKVLTGEIGAGVKALFESRHLLPFADWLAPFKMDSPEDFARVICVELAMDKMPKGLIPFHGPDGRTAFEEQLHEAKTLVGESRVENHFTVSPAHESSIAECVQKVKSANPELANVKCSFSHQNPLSDTVCVYADGELVKNRHRQILKRPGGHGALLENLNAIESDVIFIKNIDNVQPRRLQAEVVEWKKALAGLGLGIKTSADRVLNVLQMGHTLSDEDLVPLRKFFPGIPEEGPDLMRFLNRPLRVCGMVPNQGQPGGGPFWVKDKDGTSHLQIVESAEIDPEREDQKAIAGFATHFNPVDLVCFTRDFNGNKFDLSLFSNPEAVFIADKTHEGKAIKALEWPGLWNGGMAGWMTVFVEVPIFTFSPVKTVSDLLRPEHR